MFDKARPAGRSYSASGLRAGLPARPSHKHYHHCAVATVVNTDTRENNTEVLLPWYDLGQFIQIEQAKGGICYVLVICFYVVC